MLMAFGEILMNGGANNMKGLSHVNNAPPDTNTTPATEATVTQQQNVETYREFDSQDNTVTMGEFETTTETVDQETPQQRIAELEKELLKLQNNQPSKSGITLQQIKM